LLKLCLKYCYQCVINTNCIAQAALLASKVDTLLPPKVRRPKSKYAADKLRQIKKEKRVRIHNMFTV